MYKLTPQSYGLQMAQCTWGGPSGIWVECTKCNNSAKISDGSGIALSNEECDSISDEKAIKLFKKNGWTGKGEDMLKPLCPTCSRGKT
jgi:hypothetical protein